MNLAKLKMNKNYAPVIKAYIALNELTQGDVAEKINMDRALFNLKLNRKRNKKFNIDEIIDIAHVLNVTLDQIFLNSNVA